MTDVPIIVSVESKKAEEGGKRVVRTLDDIVNKSKETDQATGKLGKSLKQTGEVAQFAADMFKRLLVAFSVSRFLETADAFNTLQVRIKTATEATGDYVKVSKELFSIAQRTGTEFKTNVDVFQRIALGARDLGKTNTDVLKLVDTVQKLGVIGGSSNAALSAGLTQFGQALSGGVLRAEEFNSIIENIPEVANAIAKGLGTSVGQLRQMVIHGGVAAEDIFGALLKQTVEIDKSFANIPLNMARAFTIAKNNFGEFASKIDQAIGVTSFLAESIVNISGSAAILETTILALGAAFAFAFPQVTAVVTIFGTLAVGFNELRQIFPKVDEGYKALVDGILHGGSVFKILQEHIYSTIGAFVKFLYNIGNMGSAIVAAFASPFQKVGRLFVAFKADIKEFIANPFSDKSGFDNVANEMSKGFKETFKKAFNDVRADGKAFGEAIDQEVTSKIVALSRETKEIAKPIKDLKATVKPPLEVVDKNAHKKVKDTKDAVKELKQEVDPLSKLFERTAEDIKNSFDNVFFNIFNSGKLDLKSFLQDLKGAFAKTLAEMATMAIAKPIIVPLIQGAGNFFGVNPSSIGSVANQFGSLGSGTNGLGSLFGGVGNISSAIDAFGAANLGTANVSSSFIGPLQAGQTAGTTLSGALGAAGIGATIGSLNLFGGKQTGSTIGGAIGGFAGSFIPIPVVGTLVGSAIGSAIGGLFGAGKPTSASEFAGSFNQTGNINSTFGSKNADIGIAKTLSTQVGELGKFLTGIGANVGGVNLQGGLNTKQKGGGFFTLNGKDILFDTNNQDSVNGALVTLTKNMADLAKVSNDNLAIAIKNVKTEGRQLSEILDDLAFASAYDSFTFAVDKTTELEKSIKSLNETFAATNERVISLGLSEKKLLELKSQQLDQIKNSFNKGIRESELAITNPDLLSLKQLNQEQKLRRRDAIAAGADLNAVERLFALERQQILEKALSGQSNTLAEGLKRQQEQIVAAYKDQIGVISKIKNSLTFSKELGGTDPFTKAQAADTQLQTLLSRVKAGDLTVFKDMDQTISQSLQASLDYYGSTQSYLERLSTVDLILEESKKLADANLTAEEKLLTSSLEQNKLTLDLIEASVSQTRLLDERLTKTSGDISKIAGIDRGSLLRAGESSDILNNLNKVTNVSNFVTRAAKVIASDGQFSFSGNQTFADFVKQTTGGQDIVNRYNSIISGFGGTPQALVGNAAGNESSLNVIAQKQAQQSSKETEALLGVLSSILEQMSEMNDKVALGGLSG